MPATDPSRLADDSAEDLDEADVDEELDDEIDEETDDLSDAGLDLTDASELDADNVLADEESARVLQAPD